MLVVYYPRHTTADAPLLFAEQMRSAVHFGILVSYHVPACHVGFGRLRRPKEFKNRRFKNTPHYKHIRRMFKAGVKRFLYERVFGAKGFVTFIAKKRQTVRLRKYRIG